MRRPPFWGSDATARFHHGIRYRGYVAARGAREASPKRPTIAWIREPRNRPNASFIENFLRGMNELGYVEGRNFDVLYRFTDGHQDRLPALTEEIIRLKPDVILATAAI